MTIIGRAERFEQDHVIGWAFDSESTSEPLQVFVRVNGEAVASGFTVTPRPDVASAGGALFSGFEIHVPRKFLSPGVVIEVLCNETEIGKFRHSSSRTISGSFAGVVDEFDGMAIRGWVVNLEDPRVPVVLSVFLGTHLIGFCGGTEVRPDIQAQFGTMVPSGFVYRVPIPLRESGPSLIRFYVANSTIELGGSPFLIGASKAPDDSVHLSRVFDGEGSQ